jgi:hypothetical protein
MANPDITIFPSPVGTGTGGGGTRQGQFYSAPSPITTSEQKLPEQWNGPLSVLSQSMFSYKKLQYPGDLENDKTRYPYHMTFHINIPETSTFKSNFSPDSKKTPNPSVHSQEVSTTALQSAFRRKTMRTNQSIDLYMPDTMNWGFNHQWSGESLTQATGRAGILGAGLAGLAKSLTGTTSRESTAGWEAAKSAAMSELQIRLKDSKSKLLGKLNVNISEDLAQAVIGKAVNPNEELLYKGPGFRTFQFEFVFAPRNSADARTALDIIQAFKFHAAPELPGSDGGRYFVPPSDFDIEFYNGSQKMWQLGAIGRCVLESITVDYGAAGQFAAYPDGYPSNIRVQLQFKEIDIVTKRQIVESGF